MAHWTSTESECVHALQSLKSDDLRERLEESEKLMNEMERTWEDKLKETERIHMVSSSELCVSVCLSSMWSSTGSTLFICHTVIFIVFVDSKWFILFISKK